MMIYETRLGLGGRTRGTPEMDLPSVGRFIEHVQDGRKGRLEELVSGIQA